MKKINFEAVLKTIEEFENKFRWNFETLRYEYRTTGRQVPKEEIDRYIISTKNLIKTI